jgi:very-long-chain enoyl-CoA reductase
MPVANLFRNCAYYWAFAAYVSYFVNHPLYTAPPPAQTVAALAVSLLAQAANLRCHVLLARLRPGGAGGYVIPRGFLFDYITCPNYTAEVVGWAGFAVATQALPAAIFGAVGAAQMAQWAAAKHARLRRTFDGREGRDKYPRRWVMLPPLF